MTYKIDPNEYISTVYISKIELIKIAQGLQNCDGLVSNSAGRAASQIYRWPRGQPNLMFCQIALAGQQKTLAGHMARVDWYVQVYIYIYIHMYIYNITYCGLLAVIW